MTLTVVRLAAPLMAWPADSRYRTRHTRPDPTVSAIKGLLAAAAGVPRDGQAPQWLLSLSAAARVDIPGSLVEDFHTINPLPRSKYHWLSKRDMDANVMVRKASGGRHSGPIVTHRFFRQGQTVLLFIQDDDGSIRETLERPQWALYAGRKSCPFTFPLVLTSLDATLSEAVASFPTVAPEGVTLDAVFFQPTAGVAVTRTESVLDERAGAVGQDYTFRERFYTRVSPPRMQSWWEISRQHNQEVQNVAL